MITATQAVLLPALSVVQLTAQRNGPPQCVVAADVGFGLDAQGEGLRWFDRCRWIT